MSHRQFEHVTYMHQGNNKKMALFDKMVKLHELVHLLKLKLKDFPHHRCNAQQTSEVYDELVPNLDSHSIVQVHELLENYCQIRSRASIGCKIWQLCILLWFFKKSMKMCTKIISYSSPVTKT